jgi:DNA-binding response OmpR family regulator
MLLTGLGSSENIVTGLDTGADDYLVKPFKFSELEARVRALIRRSNYTDQKHHIITVADLTIDRVSKSVQRGGQLVRLTALEFKLLDFLARNTGIVVSRNQILESVWDIHFDMNTNVVDVYITYLRKKIDRPHPRKLIHTIKGLGYVLRDDEG